MQRCSCSAARCSGAGAPSAPARPAPRRLGLLFDPLRLQRQCRAAAAAADGSSEPQKAQDAPPAFLDSDSVALPENFCIIESPESVKDFAALQVDEIEKNIAARRNKIFLLMEEVRRLRIQMRVKGASDEQLDRDLLEKEEYPSSIPFFPPITEKTITLYTRFYAVTVAAIITFGGLVSPILEVKLGLGGQSYRDFIANMHLPTQLAQVDPIVASFCGGGVGVLTALLIVEANNAKMQEKRRCIYCEGTGYLTCGNCVGRGLSGAEVCANCAGTGKVMCTSCLCTGKKLATEHDPRVDPFTLGMME
ncbi:hypothetical protein C2E21_8129 [Chlorella sorokiniana]|uniref:Uncharacterized protein n=1 Tax=Chlorella sorokiniana TaxID=3076 RepID=A0A2P6TFI0_CHLSO|nr:hypothetical protein C2E21_8129 [Chlorella sorokiniana]|eukprot:PRW32857.1 hypothetical protein C2E21_8129 [Chlorella sorokiniana]